MEVETGACTGEDENSDGSTHLMEEPRLESVMGNKITYHSPSRGSSMEMGAAITVLGFSQYKLPVSTSMFTGATVGVGLCNGSLKAVNWKRVFLLVFSWIMTIPIAVLSVDVSWVSPSTPLTSKHLTHNF
ncbi:hypothetical protein ACKAV7_013303 [Fusarium commune]